MFWLFLYFNIFLSFAQQSEPSIFTKYQTKPQLFDEDAKEKGSLNFGAGKVKSVFENFEVNKNKIKDKYDRYVDIHWNFFLCWWLSLPAAPSSPLESHTWHISLRKVYFQVLDNLWLQKVTGQENRVYLQFDLCNTLRHKPWGTTKL